LFRCCRAIGQRTPIRNFSAAPRITKPKILWGREMRSMLLWLIGIPIPIIILLWLLTGHA
jgi:hypothetical protein